MFDFIPGWALALITATGLLTIFTGAIVKAMLPKISSWLDLQNEIVKKSLEKINSDIFKETMNDLIKVAISRGATYLSAKGWVCQEIESRIPDWIVKDEHIEQCFDSIWMSIERELKELDDILPDKDPPKKKK